MEAVFLCGTLGSTTAEGAGAEDWAWLDKMVGASAAPTGMGSSRREVTLAADSDADFFKTGGANTGLDAGWILSGWTEAASGLGRSGSSSSCVGFSGTAGSVGAFGSDGINLGSAAGMDSMEVTWLDPSFFFSEDMFSASATAPAPNPTKAASSKSEGAEAFSSAAGVGAGIELVCFLGVNAGAAATPASPADFFCGGGRVGALVTGGVAKAGAPASEAERFWAGGPGGAPKTGADFFCGGGSGGALETEAAGGMKIGADFFCRGGTGGALGTGAWTVEGLKMGADFFCGGGSGGALGAVAVGGAPKIWADFFCGGGKAGAVGLTAATGAGMPMIGDVFRWEGGTGGALVAARAGVGAEGAAGAGLEAAAVAAPERSEPVFGRGGGNGGAERELVLAFAEGAVGRVSAPVLGRGGGKGGAGSAPVRGRGKGEADSAGLAAPEPLAGRSINRSDVVILFIGVIGGAADLAGGAGISEGFNVPVSANGAGGGGTGGGDALVTAMEGGATVAGAGDVRATGCNCCVMGRAGGLLWCGIGAKSSPSSTLPLGTKTFALGLAMKTRGGGAAVPESSGTTDGLAKAPLDDVSLLFCGKSGMVLADCAGAVAGGGGGTDPGSVPDAGRRLPIGLVTAVDHAGGTP